MCVLCYLFLLNLNSSLSVLNESCSKHISIILILWYSTLEMNLTLVLGSVRFSSIKLVAIEVFFEQRKIIDIIICEEVQVV